MDGIRGAAINWNSRQRVSIRWGYMWRSDESQTELKKTKQWRTWSLLDEGGVPSELGEELVWAMTAKVDEDLQHLKLQKRRTNRLLLSDTAGHLATWRHYVWQTETLIITLLSPWVSHDTIPPAASPEGTPTNTDHNQKTHGRFLQSDLRDISS